MQPMSRADELLTILLTPHTNLPRSWKGLSRPDARTVYRGDRTNLWFVTNTGDGPHYEPFSRSDVDELIARGDITPCFPGTESADEAFFAKAMMKSTSKR